LDALKMFYQNCRRVVHDVDEHVDLRHKAEWRYLIRNGGAVPHVDSP
jgi:hypothetical protein